MASDVEKALREEAYAALMLARTAKTVVENARSMDAGNAWYVTRSEMYELRMCVDTLSKATAASILAHAAHVPDICRRCDKLTNSVANPTATGPGQRCVCPGEQPAHKEPARTAPDQRAVDFAALIIVGGSNAEWNIDGDSVVVRDDAGWVRGRFRLDAPVDEITLQQLALLAVARAAAQIARETP